MGSRVFLLLLLFFAGQLEGSKSIFLRQLSWRPKCGHGASDPDLTLLTEKLNRLRLSSFQGAQPERVGGQLKSKGPKRKKSVVRNLHGLGITHGSYTSGSPPVVSLHLQNDHEESLKNGKNLHPPKRITDRYERHGHYGRKRRDQEEPPLSIVSFNTNWLYVPSKDRGQRIDKLCIWKSPKQALRHMEVIAEQINRINAQVFVLSEVHDLDTLKALLRLLDRSWEYDAHLVPGTDNHLHMNVGVLTRLPLEVPPERLTCMAPVPCDDGTRPRPRLGVPKSIVAKLVIKRRNTLTGLSSEQRIAILGVHLRSGTRPKEAILARQVQASIVAGAADMYTKDGYRVVVAGDLNDFDKTNRGKRDHRTDSQVLETITSSGNGLVNPFGRIPRSRRFSTSEETFIDYVLVDRALSVASCEIYNYHHRPGYRYGGRTPEDFLQSDHYPVRVDIELPFGSSLDE